MHCRGRNRAGALTAHLVAADGEPQVLTEQTGPVLRVTLNRPEKLNSLNLQMIRELVKAYEAALAHESGVKCIVMTANGRAFCAGGDVAAVQQEALLHPQPGMLPADFFYEEYQLNHTIAMLMQRHQIPQIGIWNGITMGGGVGLTIHGRFRVATEAASFAFPETKIGLFPDVGGTWALPRIKGGLSQALYIGLSGERLKAADLVWSGIATHYLPAEKLPQLHRRLAALVDPSEAAIDSLLVELRGGANPDASKSLLVPHASAILRCFSAPTAEEIMSRLESEENDAVWAKGVATTIKSMSPTSVKLTMEAFKRHAKPEITISEALAMEYRMSQGCCARLQPCSDFMEGIRAVLIDKDNKPSYNPATLESVSEAAIEAFFKPLSELETIYGSGSNHPKGELQL